MLEFTREQMIKIEEDFAERESARKKKSIFKKKIPDVTIDLTSEQKRYVTKIINEILDKWQERYAQYIFAVTTIGMSNKEDAKTWSELMELSEEAEEEAEEEEEQDEEEFEEKIVRRRTTGKREYISEKKLSRDTRLCIFAAYHSGDSYLQVSAKEIILYLCFGYILSAARMAAKHDHSSPLQDYFQGLCLTYQTRFEDYNPFTLREKNGKVGETIDLISFATFLGIYKKKAINTVRRDSQTITISRDDLETGDLVKKVESKLLSKSNGEPITDEAIQHYISATTARPVSLKKIQEIRGRGEDESIYEDLTGEGTQIIDTIAYSSPGEGLGTPEGEFFKKDRERELREIMNGSDSVSAELYGYIITEFEKYDTQNGRRERQQNGRGERPVRRDSYVMSNDGFEYYDEVIENKSLPKTIRDGVVKAYMEDHDGVSKRTVEALYDSVTRRLRNKISPEKSSMRARQDFGIMERYESEFGDFTDELDTL